MIVVIKELVSGTYVGHGPGGFFLVDKIQYAVTMAVEDSCGDPNKDKDIAYGIGALLEHWGKKQRRDEFYLKAEKIR